VWDVTPLPRTPSMRGALLIRGCVLIAWYLVKHRDNFLTFPCIKTYYNLQLMFRIMDDVLTLYQVHKLFDVK
jgi:hypothetical protein